MNAISSGMGSGVLSELPINIFLYSKFFEKTFFKFFKKLHTTNLGIMSTNLTKSLFTKTYTDLNLYISKKQNEVTKLNYISKYDVKYLQPITIVAFAFQKKTYDTLMVFIISMLVNNYGPAYNSFRLYYGFIFQLNNFNMYPFLNLFYFKLRQF